MQITCWTRFVHIVAALHATIINVWTAEPGGETGVCAARGVLVMDRDTTTFPIFIACITFAIAVAITSNVWM
jgi:hypothetical protein